MRIYGVVTAENENRADAILMDLVNENILDYYELNCREDIPLDEINRDYNAVVDNEGYLTLDTDIIGGLSDLVHCGRDLRTFGFEAEYPEDY
ncbi:MAG: hypothetical protein IJ709_09105 [Selenomonas sp.]|nr:hypothetical protein [Selenomonas sp.]